MSDEAAMRCPDRRGATIAVLVLVIALLAFALGVVTAGFTDLTSRLPLRAAVGSSAAVGVAAQPTPQAVVASVPAGPPGDTERIPEAVRRVMPSVVTVLGRTSQGSGVVWSADGVIVTAAHVLDQDVQTEIRFNDGSVATAVVRAQDPGADLAVLQVTRAGLVPANFRAGVPRVGEATIVVGSPLGLTSTVTAGIISGTQRSIAISPIGRSLDGLLQTDAPISPGNSGGAVVNRDGEVVGISEAYIPPSEGAVAIGFAIPSATVTAVVTHLLHPELPRPPLPKGARRVRH